VGKSSLINALVGRRGVAKVSRTPGKTRACNVFLVDQRYYLVDLPGYGYARVSHGERRAFQRMMREYLDTRPRLAGIVWLLDVRRDPSPEDREVAAQLEAKGVPVLAAITKADKLAHGRRLERVRTIREATGMDEEQCVVTSALTRVGIDQLRDAVDLLIREPAA